MKSHVRNQLELLQVIYEDACNKCVADVFDFRDLKTFEARVKEEGLSFLTITLPEMSKDLDRSLASGKIDSTAFRSFRKTGTIPALLQGMFSQLFDKRTGRLRNDVTPIHCDDQPTVVEAIRQICRAFVKLEIPCAPERTQKAMEGFVSTERDLSEFTIDDEKVARFATVSRHLWDICLSGFDPSELTPRHGPGTTADGKSGNRKYIWERWHERLEPYFPFLGSAYTISAALEEEFQKVTFCTEGEELPVKVTPVPKTQKGPRIIAIEPVAMQYAQQAVQKWLYSRIERSAMSGGHVNFTDQSINQRLALMSSENGLFATMDLSDASDRVPLSLVKTMIVAAIDDSSQLWEVIDACRSRYAKLPNQALVGPLKKFASMGSALCFPIEAMFFYTTCVDALLEDRGLPVTRRNVYTVSREVYVYGDDLIVPRTNATAVLKGLAQNNCRVNLNKSFWSGNFRESCGVDAFRGHEVTPVYVRRLHPENRRQHDVFISLVETRNAFYKKGYWKTARYLDKVVEAHLGELPYVGDGVSLLGKFTYLKERLAISHNVRFGNFASRWNAKYQRLEVKGWVPKPAYRTDELGGYAALMKSLLTLQTKDIESLVPEDSDPLHLERTARYGVATLKRRWAPLT